MENDVRQRNHQKNRRRERAQRMQAQRDSKLKDGDSGEDESPAREKPPRPPARRKKSREPLGEEDIIDGFAIMAFRTYEDLEAAVKSVTSPRTNSLSTKPRLPLAALAGDPARNHPPNNVNSHGITLLQDAGTSDDSGRASERLTGSSVAPRDPDSSRDRLSDCDSEGDDDKASPDNSRNASPRYHDASMEDVSDGSLFRVTGAGAGGGSKSELVARGGSGGALALSRAPVGGSASPAPAPLPQPAPSPAPAALPPPALPPPAFRADTPLRSNGAHIPALDGHAATQIPTRPLTADTPERPASNKLQPGARAAADSPTPAPPAPSPHFPYQAHATLPDYRHTNHETRTVPSSPAAAAPLNLHAQLAAQPRATPATAAQHHPSLPNHAPHSQAHPVMPGHDVRNVAVTAATLPAATPFPNHVASIANHINGIPHSVAPHTAPSSAPNSLPTQTLAGRPPSPTAPHSRPYPTPTIGSSHINSSLSSSIHNHSIPYQSHASLQKHSVQSVYGSRPPHLAPFSVSNHLTTNHVPSSNHMPLSNHISASNHIPTSHPNHMPLSNHISASNHIPTSHPNHMPSSNHIPSSTASVPMSPHPGLPVNSHSANHLPTSNSSPLATSTPNHIGPTPMSVSTSTPPSFTSSIKHPGLSLPPVHAPPVNSMEPPSSGAPTIVTTSSASGHPTPAPLTTDARVPMTSDARVPVIPDSRVPITSDSRVPLTTEARVPMTPDSRVPIATEARVPAGEGPPRSEGAPVSAGYPPPAFASAPYPPLYAPYATTLQHSPYLPASAASPRNSADTRTNLSASPLVAPKTPKGVRPHTPGSTGGAAPAISHSHHVYSPRGHSPNRERDSFSSNISTLSRASGSTPVSSSPKPPPTSAAAVVTSVASGTLPTIPLAVSLAQTISAPLTGPLAAPLAVPLAAPLVAPLATPLAVPLTTPLAAPTPTPAAPGAPLFPHSLAPVPTVPSISSSAKPPAHWGQTRPSAADRPAFPAGSLFGAPLAPPNPNPFSAESLFQTSPGADLLRRELDNRFLAAAGGFSSVRTEMHHHQHQHTHVHHPPAAPPPAAPPPAPHHSHHPHHHAPQPPPPPPLHHAAPHHPHQYHPAQHHATLFKDVSKMSLYRSGLGLGYPYSSSLLHPAAPYVAPAPLSAYAPKPVVSAASDPATKPVPRPVAKTGKWNAMHVRIAWEIYNHQQKEKASGGGGGGGLSSSLDKDKLRAFPPPPAAAPPPPQPYRSPYDLPPHYLPPHPHLGMSPFARYGASGFHGAPPPFGLSPYARELALSSSLHGVHHPPSLAALHEAWRAGGAAQPRAPVPPQPTAAQVEARRDHEERARRERDERERERRDRDERERRKQRERELERVRQRSPLRNGVPEPPKEERKEAPRPPPALPPYPPAAWDPYRSYDPLHHMRFPPLVEAAIRAEEDRAKMLSAYAHHQQLKAAPLLHRAPLPPLAHATLPPLPLPHGHAPLDMLKKEEPR